MTIKGCIFDLDGVLVDTARYHFLAWQRIAIQLGFEFTEADNERLKGISRAQSLDILLEIGGLNLTGNEKEKLASTKNRWFQEYIDLMTVDELLPGVEAFIDLLVKEGYAVALGSASQNARRILRQVGLIEKFNAIVDGTMVSKAKPDPEVFLLAAKQLNLEPAECIVFEDAIAGVEAAHRAGMLCIGVGNPQVLVKANKIIPGFLHCDLTILDFNADGA